MEDWIAFNFFPIKKVYSMSQFEKKQTNSKSIVIVNVSKRLDQEKHTHTKAKNVLD